MINFIGSIEAGLNAAKNAEKNKLEIQSVFDELNRQLNDKYKGLLFVDREEFYVNDTFMDLARIANLLDREKYSAITAKNPLAKEYKSFELAKWKMDRNGYPCQIIFGHTDKFCEDKASLEQALMELLREPTVGDKLYNAMKLELND